MFSNRRNATVDTVAAVGCLLSLYVARSLYWHVTLSCVSKNCLFTFTEQLIVMNSAKYWALIF